MWENIVGFFATALVVIATPLLYLMVAIALILFILEIFQLIREIRIENKFEKLLNKNLIK